MAAKRRRSTEDPQGYQSIAAELRDQIRGGALAAGSLLPTERELQESFGVSRSTVRRALNALAESGWAEIKPNRGVSAKVGPSVERNNNVAFVDHAETLDKELFFNLGRQVQKHGYNLVHIDSRAKGLEGALEYALEQNFAAAFVWSKKGFPDVERVRAVQREIPVIAVDHTMRAANTDLISEDNLGGASLAVRHLASLGRKRIAISGMMDMLEINHERFSGYLMGLFEHGLSPSPRDFLFCVTSGMDVADTLPLERRLADPDRPDAIFVLQDMFAPAVAHTVLSCGLRVPEDVAIVAFGHGSSLLIDSVGLTQVSVDTNLVAETATEQLMTRLSSPTAPVEHVVLPVQLVVRGSCGAPPSDWDDCPPLTPAEQVLAAPWRNGATPLHIHSTVVENALDPADEATPSRRTSQ